MVKGLSGAVQNITDLLESDIVILETLKIPLVISITKIVIFSKWMKENFRKFCFGGWLRDSHFDNIAAEMQVI